MLLGSPNHLPPLSGHQEGWSLGTWHGQTPEDRLEGKCGTLASSPSPPGSTTLILVFCLGMDGLDGMIPKWGVRIPWSLIFDSRWQTPVAIQSTLEPVKGRVQSNSTNAEHQGVGC